MEFDGASIIVTGGGSGIGRAVALKFAELGAGVMVADVAIDKAEETVALVEQARGKASAIRVDVTQRLHVLEMASSCLKQYGKIDVVVNNAGWNKYTLFVEENEEYWDKIIAINLKGAILCCSAVLPDMVKRAKGAIVNVASDAGRIGTSRETVYAAAKGGVIAFTKSLAREVARYNINVNCVSPGPTDTPLFHSIHAKEEDVEKRKKLIPFRRLGRPEEIADAIVYLASSRASYITGQVLSVNGGITMVG